jgi:diaminopropionate ammonia-lyase
MELNREMTFMLNRGWSYLGNKNMNHTVAIRSDYLTEDVARITARFHQKMEGYVTTPLVSLRQLARQLNIGGIYIKDLSNVLGLDSFKILGASYAIFKILCPILGLDTKKATFADLKVITSDRLTFVSATDGNFGKSVAWVAQQLGQKAIVYVPHDMTGFRRDSIEKFGAQVLEPSGEDKTYDGAIHEVSTYIGRAGYLPISDMAWSGFEEIPLNVMQGYLTICSETKEQLKNFGVKKPSHIFVQVGCGGFAASVIGFFNSVFGTNRPISVIVEPTSAACVLKSMQSNKLTRIKTDYTIMAGLYCGEPSSLAWPILRGCVEHYIAIPDDIATYGVELLSNPKPPDEEIVSGETGACCVGCLAHILKTNPAFARELNITKDSNILLFNTEGLTGGSQ